MDSSTRKQLIILLCVMGGLILAAGLFLPLFFRGGQDNSADDGPKNSIRIESLEWREVAGYNLPISPTFGPTKAEKGFTSGFTQNENGAGLAATHYLFSTSDVAPKSVSDLAYATSVRGQFSSSLQQATDNARLQRTPDSSSLPIAGWEVNVLTDALAEVDVYFSNDDAYFYLRTNLRWEDNDWKLVAPDGWKTQVNAFGTTIPPKIDLTNFNPSIQAVSDQASLINPGTTSGNTTSLPSESGDGEPPTAEDFLPGSTLVTESSAETLLKQFGQAYFMEDYTVSYTEKTQSLKAFTTPELYIEILEDQPENFETEQAKRFEKKVTVVSEPRISKLTEGAYRITAEVEERSTSEVTQRVTKQITVEIKQDSEAKLVSEILVDL